MPPAAVTVAEALWAGTARLTAAGIPGPALDARVLLRHMLGLSPEALYLALDHPLPATARAGFDGLVVRRAAGEPVAYLTGSREFYGLTFRVSPDVLIPRPETELLVERAVKLLPTAALVVDVGTGSGAIAVAVAANRPDATMVAVDRSLAACKIARQNAEEQGLAARVGVVQSNLLSAVAGAPEAVLANLPYVPDAELATLQPEVKHEPRLALVGGPDGLDLYRRLFANLATRRPAPKLVLCEHAPDQADTMLDLCRSALPWLRATMLTDLAGRPRLLEAIA